MDGQDVLVERCEDEWWNKLDDVGSDDGEEVDGHDSATANEEEEDGDVLRQSPRKKTSELSIRTECTPAVSPVGAVAFLRTNIRPVVRQVLAFGDHATTLACVLSTHVVLASYARTIIRLVISAATGEHRVL